MAKKLEIIATIALMLCVCSCRSTSVVNLQTDYMTEPIGIDNPEPQFSWQMASSRYGAAQTAYEITVTADGVEYFNSGFVQSDRSVGIRYGGSQLQPCTKYNWNLKVWDEKGNVTRTSSTFETGLMDSGWSEAKWIGSKQPHFSKYRSSYVIEYDMTIPEGSDQGTFIMGYQDENNYVAVTLDVSKRLERPLFIVKHVTEGVEVQDFAVDVYRIRWDELHNAHRYRLTVVAEDYAKGYKLSMDVDDQPVFGKKAPIVVRHYPLDQWKPYCRFNKIGFKQSEGNDAVFANITVSENVWNTTLYSSTESYQIKGGTQTIISPAEESGAPMLRKAFTIERPLESARLYTTAKGIYEYYINGKRLTQDMFNPGSTDYRYRIMYNTYDITQYLKKGGNAVGVQLGAGWYSDFTGFATAWQDQFGTELSLLSKIVLTYTDGSQDTIVSDDGWKVYDKGPITSDSFQNGEDYDARREVSGWSTAEFDDSKWSAVKVFPDENKAEISYYVGSPAAVNTVLTAVSVSEPKAGVFVYDMGQNMVGVPSINVVGSSGDVITLKYGEMVYPDNISEYADKRGLPYNENYRGALSTDHYILSGATEGETIQPHFTFHGYRYVQIEGLKKALPLKNVKGLVINSIGDKIDSGFETSDKNINRLYSNIVWGQRGNFVSIPTDCPQRDERMGWTGDAQVFARTATYNANVAPFFNRWFYSVRDIQGDDGSYCDFIPKVGNPPYGSDKGGGALGWMEAGIIIPWQMYQQYGDIAFVEKNYDSMAAYIEYLKNRSVYNVQPGSGYGDWVALEHTNSPLTNTAYYAYDVLLMSKMARALGKEDDALKYEELYNEIKVAFNTIFVNWDGTTRMPSGLPAWNEWIAGGADSKFVANTQTSYVVPLQADLFDERSKPLAIQHLVDNVEEHGYTITTGFIGTPYINLVLSDAGHDDVAFRLFEQIQYPSWLYPVLQGATTMWERWNSYTIENGFGMVDMNSFNHYSFGAIQEWMMAYLLGIQRNEDYPAYKRIILQPRVGGSLEYARGHYDTMYGKVVSSWHLNNNGYTYKAIVPANTTAELHLQLTDGALVEFTEGDSHYEVTGDPSVFLLPAGKYTVKVTY